MRGGKHAGSEPVSRGIGLHDFAISVGVAVQVNVCCACFRSVVLMRTFRQEVRAFIASFIVLWCVCVYVCVCATHPPR